jgi:arylsulfatase A-like enzyme
MRRSTSSGGKPKPQKTILLLAERHAHAPLHPCATGYKGPQRLSEYIDGMLEHDGHVGNLLKVIDERGIANNAILIYGTDNGRT